MSVFTDWKAQVLGNPLDIDGAYGDQCVDVAMSYVQTVFPGHKWPELLGFGNAKDLYAASNANYFEKIANNPNDVNQLPVQGDIIVYGATSTNPYGHIAVVDNADSGGVNEVEQNGFNPTGTTYEIYRVWGRSPCIGWLRPKYPQAPVNINLDQLTQLYQDLLHRAPDQGGIDHYVGHYTYDFVKQDIMSSQEYKIVHTPAPQPAPSPTPEPAPTPVPTPVVPDPTPAPATFTAATGTTYVATVSQAPPAPVVVPMVPAQAKKSLWDVFWAWVGSLFNRKKG